MKTLEKILSVICGCFLIVMFGLCLIQVILRKLEISATFTEEFARMAYIWLVFLMLPVLESRDSQMKVTYFLSKFPMKVQLVLYWFMSLCYCGFLILLLLGSFKLASTPTVVHFASTPWLTTNISYFPMVIGSALGIIFVLNRAIHAKDILKKESEEYDL